MISRQKAYSYSVARIRAMELRLLDAPLVQRIMDSEDITSALKILGETSYAPSLTSNGGVSNFDKMLDANLLEVYEEVRTFVPDKEIVDILRLPYDFHNVKVILKSMFNVRNGGKKRWDLLTSLGSYPLDSLIANVETEDYRLLPFGFGELLPNCISRWEQTKDVLEIERMLDARLFETMFEIASKLGVPGVTAWIQARIDGENIRTMLRLKRFGFDGAKALPFFHANGTIDRRWFPSLISEPFDAWASTLDFSDIGKVLRGIEASDDLASLIPALERELDNFYMDMLAPSKYSPSAPENIPAYLWAKETEVKNLRMILVSKVTKGDPEQLRRLLRHAYV